MQFFTDTTQSQRRSASEAELNESDSSKNNKNANGSDCDTEDSGAEGWKEPEMNDKDSEDWEQELDDKLNGSPSDAKKDWATIQAEITEKIKRDSKIMPVSSLNKYYIIMCFGTLSIKGLSQMKASEEVARQWHEKEGIHFAHRVWALVRHYQIFTMNPASIKRIIRAGPGDYLPTCNRLVSHI